MLRRILFASALIFVSATAFTSEAKAQVTTTGTVEFNGLIGGACSFSNPVAGTLVVNSGDPNLLGSDPTGAYPGGVPAEIDISCTTDATLTIANPRATGDSLATATFSAAATSSNLGLDFDSQGGATSNAIASGEQDTIRVNMTVDNQGTTVPDGTYNYEVVITATP